MSIDTSENELYGDFVKMVDKVSSAVISKTVEPLSGQIKIASDAMQKTSQVLRSTSDKVDGVTSKSIKDMAEQTRNTVEALRKINAEMDLGAKTAIKGLSAQTQNTEQLLKKTSEGISSVAAKAIQEAIAPISGQIDNTVQILKKTSDDIGIVAGKAIQKEIFSILKQFETTSQVMKQASSDIGTITKGANENKNLINSVSSKIDRNHNLLVTQIDEKNVAVVAKIHGAVDVFSHSISDVLYKIEQNSSGVESKIEFFSESLVKKIETDIKFLLNKNFDSIQKDITDVKIQNRRLEIQIASFQKKQQQLLNWVIGICVFFGLAILVMK